MFWKKSVTRDCDLKSMILSVLFEYFEFLSFFLLHFLALVHIDLISCLALTERLYLITDGGRDRNVVHVSVQKALVSLFLKFNFEEIVAIRTAAHMSFYNPIERVHARTNLALQSIGMMREEMTQEMERLIKSANSNDEVRKLCERHPEMAESLRKSLDMPIKLLENLFGELSLNDSPFRILKPATSAEIIEYENELEQIKTN